MVDNADNSDEMMMSEDLLILKLSNQYMLFLRNCDGLNVSDKSFKVLKFDR